MLVTKILSVNTGGASGKESAGQCGRHERPGFDSWVGKISWRRAWQPTLVFLLGESHEQRNLEGYSPWGLKESETTETKHPQRAILRVLFRRMIKIYVPCSNSKTEVLISEFLSNQ